ncbi:metal-sulfur cluster assembly factor [Thermaerobacter subterraneus]|uniref:metal-sulfur cluster assembly factor n=1 Tax=Thermaerobacter subterraneus TaxID=175696 RepID=UPI000A0093BA|nr:iron-sulfur cluster assembly protein [Thermaerobacter subterraneus]
MQGREAGPGDGAGSGEGEPVGSAGPLRQASGSVPAGSSGDGSAPGQAPCQENRRSRGNGGAGGACRPGETGAQGRGGPAARRRPATVQPEDQALRDALWQALAEVPDPEIPVVSVVDLGMVEAVEADARAGRVQVTLLPTFVGCPALGLIRQAVAGRLQAVPGVREVEVRVAYSPPWSTDRITPAGRRKLASFGIAPPPPVGAGRPAAGRSAPEPHGPGRLPGGDAEGAGAGKPDAGMPGAGAPDLAAAASQVPPGPAGCGALRRLETLAAHAATCPFCGSRRTRRENAFGPTPCRSLWYCLDCRNPFEQMKAL